jgi:hypothetical protein
MSSTRADRRSGSLAGPRLCMVMYVGNSGGSRAWQGLLGRRADWGSEPTPVHGCPQRIRLRTPGLGSASSHRSAFETTGDSPSQYHQLKVTWV